MSISLPEYLPAYFWHHLQHHCELLAYAKLGRTNANPSFKNPLAITNIPLPIHCAELSKPMNKMESNLRVFEILAVFRIAV